MHTLTHFRLCPKSRSIRIALAEIGVEAELAEERPWEWRPAFLALNPAGELPVLALEGGFVKFCNAVNQAATVEGAALVEEDYATVDARLRREE